MPKRREIDFVATGTPEQVAEKLKGQTRWSLSPHQSSLLGKGGFKGRVSPAGFSLSDDQRTFFSTLKAVASCELTARADGSTRVHGTVGLPVWITWTLRLAMVLVPVIVGLAAVTIASGGGLAIAGGAALFAAMLTLAVLSVGRQVANADSEVDSLSIRLEQLLSPAVGHETDAEVERQRIPQRQRE